MEKRKDKHAVIYFEQGAQAAMKDLAAQIRGEGGKTTLIWAKKWVGDENMLPEARAVIIQKGCANEEKIVNAYRKWGVDVEIHFVNEEGIGIDAEAYEEEAADVAIEETNPEPVPEEEVYAATDAEANDIDAIEADDDESADDDIDPVQDGEGTDPGDVEKDRLED